MILFLYWRDCKLAEDTLMFVSPAKIMEVFGLIFGNSFKKLLVKIIKIVLRVSINRTDISKEEPNVCNSTNDASHSPGIFISESFQTLKEKLVEI